MKPSLEHREWRFACLTVSSLLFAGIALAVALGATDDFDAVTRAAVNSMASPPATALAQALSFLGSVLAVTTLSALTAGYLWLSGEKRSALMLLAVYVAAVIVNNAVKLSFARARPEVFFGTAPDSFSFASGHAIFSACYYGVAAGLFAARLAQPWQRALVWAVAALLILGVGWSRVYLGVHYLSDVIAGFALAALIVCAARGLLSERP